MEQDWLWGLAGGLLIGCAAAVYLLGNGRIMGASGILGGLVDGSGCSNLAERLVFLGAMVLAPLCLIPLYTGEISTHLGGATLTVIVAGVLVGIGTRIANGCTSGHGVCGISRLSPRGIVATLIYILAGGITLLALRHALGVI
jgi:uncharacterized membrane protein YedE/YeeE